MLATRVETWKQELRQEGEAALLLRLLERRFGKVPNWASERISSGDMATLETWALRVLDASTIEEVFV